jgi:hypothetical protein
MWRNDDPTALPTFPTPGAPGTPGYYGDETIVTPDAINAMQEELCNAVTSLGLTLNKAQVNQLAQALALLAPLAGPLFTGEVGIGTASPVKELHIAGADSAEIEIECTGGLADYRSWNLCANGTGGAKQQFIIRLMSDDGLTTQLNGILINPTTGQVTLLVPTPAQGDNSNNPASTAYVQNALFGQTDLTGAYEFALTDVGQTFRAVFGSGTLAWTIPAYASVPFAQGARIYGVVETAVVVDLGITSDTLIYPAGGLTGPRTITGPALFTVHHVTDTGWYLDASNGVT